MEKFISLIVVIISKCLAKYQVVYLKYTQFLFVKYTFIKMGGKDFLKFKSRFSKGTLCSYDGCPLKAETSHQLISQGLDQTSL